MSDPDFRDDLRAAVRRHSDELGAADLRKAADDLETLADRWDSTEDVL